MQAGFASPTEYMRSRKSFLNTVKGYSKLTHQHERKQEETKDREHYPGVFFKMPKSQGTKTHTVYLCHSDTQSISV